MHRFANKAADVIIHDASVPHGISPACLHLQNLLLPSGFDKKVLEAQEEEERERQLKKDRKRERRVSISACVI